MLYLVFAFVFFVIATFIGPPASPEAPWHSRITFHWGWAGLAAWVASLLFK